MALQTKPLDAMSSALGVTIEEAPAAPSVRDVLVRVPRQVGAGVAPLSSPECITCAQPVWPGW